MYKGYSWSCSDVLSLLSVSFNPDKEEQTVPCPFCGSKRFGMNIKKGTGHCFKCGARFDDNDSVAAPEAAALAPAPAPAAEKPAEPEVKEEPEAEAEAEEKAEE